jgi:hypothetical protein
MMRVFLMCALFQLQNALNRVVGDASIVQRYEQEKVRNKRECVCVRVCSQEVAHVSSSCVCCARCCFVLCQSNLEDAELRLQQAKGQEETLLRTVNEKKEEWMSKVDVMIKTIHKHFDKYFARIGCKGSVELQVGENGSYGILIKVSFRAGVAPQPLTASSQSGGEKSVSTMLYLLCLQEVTHCLADDHQVLTNRGFLFRSEVKAAFSSGESLTFATYDPASSKLHYAPAAAFIDKPAAKHAMVQFMAPSTECHWGDDAYSGHNADGQYSNHVSLLVTDGHRMLASVGNDANITTEPFSMVDAADLLPSGRAGRGRNVDPTYVKLPAAAVGGAEPEAGGDPELFTRLGLKTSEHVDAFIELYGYWLGDGSMQFHRPSVGGWNCVRFSPTKDQDKSYLRNLLARLPLQEGVGWRSWDDVRRVDDDDDDDDEKLVVRCTEFIITDKSWFTAFAQEYGSKYKYGGGHAASREPEPARLATVSASTSSAAADMEEEEEEEEDEAPLRLGTLSKESWCPDDTPQKSSTGRTPKGPTTKCLLCNMSVADNASSRCEHRRKSCMGTKHSFARRAEADKAASKAAAYARRHEDDEMHASVPQSAQGDGVSRPALETSAVAVPAIKSAKWFWWWVLRRLSAARLELLLRGLRWADGNQHSQGTADEPTGSPAIYTSSTSFRDEVMLACLHAGYAAVFKRKHKAGDIKTHGLQSAGSTTARDVTATVDGWIVMYSKNDTVRFPRLRRAEAVSPSEYHGPVWCVNVPPFNTIVVRRAATAQVTYDNGATLTVVSKASRPIIVGNCPFRMVDEINQGMDATNERRIFNQIVRSCEDVRIDDAGQRIEPPQSVEPNSVELKHMNKRDDDEFERMAASHHPRLLVCLVCVRAVFVQVLRCDAEVASRPSLQSACQRAFGVQRSTYDLAG